MGRGHNHKPWCTCNWCTSTWVNSNHKRGERGSGPKVIKRPTVGPKYPSGIPAIQQVYDSYVNPNARCPVCGASVFFYQSPYGGRVFFDALGPPWLKHPCTDNRNPKSFKPLPLHKDKRPQTTQPRSSKKYQWQKAGWHPYFINEIIPVGRRRSLQLVGTANGFHKMVYIAPPKGLGIRKEYALCFIKTQKYDFELSIFYKDKVFRLKGYRDFGELIQASKAYRKSKTAKSSQKNKGKKGQKINSKKTKKKQSTKSRKKTSKPGFPLSEENIKKLKRIKPKIQKKR